MDRREDLYKNFIKNKNLKKINQFCFEGKIKYQEELTRLIHIYLSENISYSGYKVKKSELDFLINNKKNILKIKTLSLNGAIYPKKETQLIYNLIIVYILKSLDSILPYIDSMFLPTIRLKTNKKTNNSFSTNILHSDAWSSGDTSDAVISIPITGDIVNNGVNFFECKTISDDFFLEQKNYVSKDNLYGKIKKIYSLRKKHWVIFDHSILHQSTTNSDSKPRISVDIIVCIKKRSLKNINYKLGPSFSPKELKKIGQSSYIDTIENYEQAIIRNKNKDKKKKFLPIVIDI